MLLPVNMPAADTVAIAVLLLFHTPLPEGSLNNAVDPIQIAIVPVMAAGATLTVTVAETLQPPGKV
jgi:hypothetical protein